MKKTLSDLIVFAACLCAAIAAQASVPKYATPQAAMEALAVACESKYAGYEKFKYPVNMVAMSDILASGSTLEKRPANPKFTFGGSRFFQNQFFHGSQGGRIAGYTFPHEYIKYPWQSDAIRKANLTTVGKNASIARVTNNKGQTAWFVLRRHQPASWRAVAIAETKEQAHYYAQDKFWKAYVAAKTEQLRKWTEKREARDALAKKLYSQVRLEGSAFYKKSHLDGTQVLNFTLTIVNDTDYTLNYADGSLSLKDEAKKHVFGASFSTRKDETPVPPHSRVPYSITIVYNDLKMLGGNELVMHYKTGLELLEQGKIPYEVTLSLAGMVRGNENIGISDSHGALPPMRANPDLYPDYEFSNERETQ